jgi:hypothetical protein
MASFRSVTTMLAAGTFVLAAASPMVGQPASQERMMPNTSSQMLPPAKKDMMDMMCRREVIGMADHVEGRIAFLKTELHINENQIPQWSAFAEALRTNAKRMGDLRDAMTHGEGDSAPNRLDRMEKMMDAMTAAVKTTRSALVPLYGVLTNEQKKVANQLICSPVGTGHPHLMHGPMGMGRM